MQNENISESESMAEYILNLAINLEWEATRPGRFIMVYVGWATEMVRTIFGEEKKMYFIYRESNHDSSVFRLLT